MNTNIKSSIGFQSYWIVYFAKDAAKHNTELTKPRLHTVFSVFRLSYFLTVAASAVRRDKSALLLKSPKRISAEYFKLILLHIEFP